MRTVHYSNSGLHYSTSVEAVLQYLTPGSTAGQPVWVLSKEENSAAKWKLKTAVVFSISFVCVSVCLCVCVCLRL